MKILSVILFLLSANSFGCEFDLPRSLNYFTSLKKEQTKSFDINRTLHDVPLLRAYNCQKLAFKGRHIMIGLGPELNEFDDQVRSYSFNDNITTNGCRIDNPPLEVLSFKEKLKDFKLKKRYFSQCLDVYVEDEGRLPLQMKVDQPGCSVTKISKHKAVFNGGYCFVKPNVTSSFIFKLKVKKRCQNKFGFTEFELQPSDLKGILNFYSVGDDTGHSTSLRALDSLPLRLITNTDEDVIKSSNSYGELNPQFPSQWVNPDVHVGKVNLEDFGGHRVKINTPVLVDNRCKKVCKEGLCYGPCEYAQPVVFETKLLSKNRHGKFKTLTYWYDGGVAAPKYQGFIRGLGFEIPTHYLKVGENYKLQLSFKDPKFDFERFKNRIIRKFGMIQQQLPEIGRSEIPTIPDINEIITTAEMPEIREILGMNFMTGIEGLKKSIDLLRSYIGFKIWPPYYEEVCDKNLKNCMSPSADKTQIIVDFTVKKNDRDQKELVITRVERKSALVKEYIRTTVPTLNCN